MELACRVHTPLGIFTALYDDGTIRRVFFPGEPLPAVLISFDDTLPFAAQVSEYFAGHRKAFDLPLSISGTPFRRDVYRATLALPYGETATYADVAFAAGYPRAMRAVGSAMKATQLPLIIPCHRVVHKARRNDAYRFGVGFKQYLLALEQKYK